MKNNKLYFSCCRSKSVSQENLHDDDGGPQAPGTRRPNPIIVGLANHLREHHSSARNSAVAGCFGFSDSPPKYEDIYAAPSDQSDCVVSRSGRHQRQGICNEDGTKSIMAEEAMTTSDNELPPPSYKESVEMASGFVVVNVTIHQT